MRDQPIKQTGLYLVAIAYVLALCAAVPAEPTPAAAPTPSLEILPGPPSKGESEPSRQQTPAPGAAPQGEVGWQLPPLVPRPDFISRRPFIPNFLLKDKREGRFITAVPAIGWDQQAGLTLGVVGFLFNNGKKDDPFFRTTPYRQQISVTALGTLSGAQRYAASLDQPNIFDSPYRLRAAVQYAIDPLNNYFGIGRASMQDLHFPRTPGRLFGTYNGYQDALRQAVDGLAYTKYDLYESRRTSFDVAVERDMFGGIVRPLIGIGVRYTDLRDFTGSKVDAEDSSGHDVSAIEQPTRTHTDCVAGVITGCHGGFENLLKLGISLDTLDFEPDPYSGVLAQVVAEFSGKALGSDFEYERVTSSISGYRMLFPAVARLVLAGRGLYSMQFGNVPFFSVPTVAFNTRDRSGLGGFATMRGFVDRRFVGDSAVLVNTELRWSIFDGGYVFGQHLRPMLAPFVDAGRVFNGTQLRFDGWRADYGIGFRLIWNLVTTVSFDYGISSEGQIFQMDLGYAF
jgi:outer membrane protein assembly factor BamA